MLPKQQKRIRRHRRLRAKIKGAAKVPRLCVFRSNRYIYAQAIDDAKGRTLASSQGEDPKKVGQEIAKKCLKLNIKKAVFDRGGYKYHGRVKALAEAAREGGLKF